MAEVQSPMQSTKPRGQSRGGRGGISSKSRGSHHGGVNGDSKRPTKDSLTPKSSADDEGELGQLKTKYSEQLSILRDMFPNWTDEDIVYALQDANGNLENTIEHMTQGHAAHWGEVKKKDRSRSKVPDESGSLPKEGSGLLSGRGARGGRGAAGASRGGRGRGRGGLDRGQTAGGRGGQRATSTAGTETPTAPIDISTPPAVSSWDSGAPAAESESAGFGDEQRMKVEEEAPKSTVIPTGSKKSWASMFAKPPPQAAPKSLPEPTTTEPEPSLELEEVKEESAADVGIQGLPPPTIEEPPTAGEVPDTPSTIDISTDGKPVQGLPPPKTELTESNLALVPDSSDPAPTGTMASTIAPSQLPEIDPGDATPGRPSAGYNTTANRLIGTPSRGPGSYRRPVLQQRESVVMPSNHAVDQTVVQFGSFGLTGEADAVEDAETRAQPPPHSPEALPKMSLPGDTRAPTHPSELQGHERDWSYTAPPASSSMPAYPASSMGHMGATSQAGSYQPIASDHYGGYAPFHHQQQQMQQQTMHQQSAHQQSMQQPPMHQQSQYQQPVHQQSQYQQPVHQQSQYQQPMGSASGKDNELQQSYGQYGSAAQMMPTSQSALHQQSYNQQPDIAAYYAAMASRGGLSSPYGPQDVRSSDSGSSFAQQQQQQRTGSGMGSHMPHHQQHQPQQHQQQQHQQHQGLGGQQQGGHQGQAHHQGHQGHQGQGHQGQGQEQAHHGMYSGYPYSGYGGAGYYPSQSYGFGAGSGGRGDWPR